MRRSAKTVGVVAERLLNTLMRPLFSATKTRPSDAKRTAVGLTSPLSATVSWNPLTVTASGCATSAADAVDTWVAPIRSAAANATARRDRRTT